MSDFFNEALKGGLDSLTADQLDELIIMAHAKRSEIRGKKEIKTSDSCPFCGSIRIKKHGKSRKGTPRKICKDCGKTFSFGIDTLEQNTRLSDTKLAALYVGIVENQTIANLAQKMKVSRSTAAQHKLKIMDILYQRMMAQLRGIDDDGNPIFKFEGEIQCDEWFCTVSFKGKRDPEFFIFTLKRFPRHNCSSEDQDKYLKKHDLWNRVIAIPGYLEELRENTKRYKRGISNEQACIVVAVDDEKNLIAKPVSVGRLETADAKKLLSGHFDNGSTLITDSHSAYPVLAKSEKINHVQIKADKHTEGRYNLASVNGIHSQIEKFMPESAERIPATKYLNQYMALFIWQWLHKGLTLDEKVIMLKRTLADSWDDYKESYESIKSRPLDINTKGQFPNVV
ncbi:MAG: IS1595 family transposase [Oscillospiraceae bacterium]|nr:IS1595 family transposase [Oscillospiraceae bacterium]